MSEMHGKEGDGDARNPSEGIFENYNQLAEEKVTTENGEKSGKCVEYGS